MTAEEWRAVKGFRGLYLVSNLGRIMNARSGQILKPKTLPNGYQRIKVTAIEGSRDRYVHRLVAEAFCNKPKGCNVVNHIDCDKTNNRADNLEWTTQKGNIVHAIKQGKMKAFPVVGYKDGKEFHFVSAHEASIATGCDDKSILRCCEHRYVHTHGYRWEYEEVG